MHHHAPGVKHFVLCPEFSDPLGWWEKSPRWDLTIPLFKMPCHRNSKHTVSFRSCTDFSSGKNSGQGSVLTPATAQAKERVPTCTHVILRAGDLHTGKIRFLLVLTLAGRKPLPGAVIPGKGKGKGVSSRRRPLLVSFVSFRNFCIIEESLAALVNVHDRQLARNLKYLENNLLNQKLLWLIKHITFNLIYPCSYICLSKRV